MTDDVTVELPPTGTLVARGLGWGTLLGALAGYLLVAVALAVAGGASWVAVFYALTLFGFAGAIVGAGYGLVAGGAIALLLTPLRRRRVPSVAVRTVSAVVGAMTVVVLSFVLFSPDLSVGHDRGRSSAVEELLVFYVLPAAAAILAGSFLSPRLLQAGADIVEHHDHALSGPPERVAD